MFFESNKINNSYVGSDRAQEIIFNVVRKLTFVVRRFPSPFFSWGSPTSKSQNKKLKSAPLPLLLMGLEAFCDCVG